MSKLKTPFWIVTKSDIKLWNEAVIFNQGREKNKTPFKQSASHFLVEYFSNKQVTTYRIFDYDTSMDQGDPSDPTYYDVSFVGGRISEVHDRELEKTKGKIKEERKMRRYDFYCDICGIKVERQHDLYHLGQVDGINEREWEDACSNCVEKIKAFRYKIEKIEIDIKNTWLKTFISELRQASRTETEKHIKILNENNKEK
jgi:hypothetical protein